MYCWQVNSRYLYQIIFYILLIIVYDCNSDVPRFILWGDKPQFAFLKIVNTNLHNVINSIHLNILYYIIYIHLNIFKK